MQLNPQTASSIICTIPELLGIGSHACNRISGNVGGRLASLFGRIYAAIAPFLRNLSTGDARYIAMEAKLAQQMQSNRFLIRAESGFTTPKVLQHFSPPGKVNAFFTMLSNKIPSLGAQRHSRHIGARSCVIRSALKMLWKLHFPTVLCCTSKWDYACVCALCLAEFLFLLDAVGALCAIEIQLPVLWNVYSLAKIYPLHVVS